MRQRIAVLSECRACPRHCGVDRSKTKGFCGETDRIRLAYAGLHFGEEPPLTAGGGSGTLFFSGCSLQCPHCQNWQISRGLIGQEISDGEFLRLCKKLEDAGAANLNLVTPTHFIPSLSRLLPLIRQEGILLPLVWNSGGYEDEVGLASVEPFIDLYLSDLKTLDSALANDLYGLPDYPDCVTGHLLRATRQRPLKWEGDKLVKGVIVRHLILPGYPENTRRALEWFARNLNGKALLSVMSQYTPVKIPGVHCSALPASVLGEEEYSRVLALLEEFGIEDGYVQELETGSDWLPDFQQRNPFASTLARTLWSPQEPSGI